ncbi:MAG: molybdopterin-dependent oxidoreductase [Alphaproteobacteria bacterium]|nr:molybdopterin-dependent oxidoreductase [Alphaproteobacteria bacterium]
MTTERIFNHWGIGLAQVQDGRITSVNPYPDDRDPSAINSNIPGSLHGAARVLNPAIRKGWLERQGVAPNGERGRDEFVEVSWDVALDLIAGELQRVKDSHGNEGIYAGSYGWSSAGRFHHAQSQLKRFLNCFGGAVTSQGNYSYNAAMGMMPYIVGPYRQHIKEATRWPVIARHGELVVMFGGMAARNMQVSDGGISQHRMKDNLAACRENGVRFVNISPHRGDLSGEAEWLAPTPGSDVAIMMGMAHHLITKGLHDQGFLDRYTTGFAQFQSHLMGEDGTPPKDADWAEARSGVAAERLRSLAEEMARHRTMISVAAGVQRTDYGEQPLWMAMTLAAMLGQIGLPGGGYVVGYAVNGNIGAVDRPFRWGSFPQGDNPVKTTLPVAMISDMLLNPGASYDYHGQRKVFPDARIVWWAGGNPFHHHQDLNRLRAAFQRPDTVIVNEINWTSSARHADIVLPVAATEERRDIGGGQSDNALIPMNPVTRPPGQARVEYDIYTDLASRLGIAEAFTEGRGAEDWLKLRWSDTFAAAKDHGIDLPQWQEFMAGAPVEVVDPAPEMVFLKDFRDDPVANPLPTPSGKLEIFSETLAGFGLADCRGHASYFPPRDEVAGDIGPLYMVSGQPKTRLHSQLDNGAYSMSHKIKGREPVLIHPRDAAERGIADGDIVELHNPRGRCLAGAVVTEDIRQGVVFLWTGAWFDPDFDHPHHRDRHGNPNTLTHDQRSSSLTQSPASHSAMVELSRFDGEPPAVTVHDQPKLARSNQAHD